MRNWNNLTSVVVFGMALVALCSCTVHAPPSSNTGAEIKQTLQNSIKTDQALDKKYHSKAPPAFLNEALTPTLSSSQSTTKQIEPRFDIAVKSVPIQDFFIGLVKDTKENIMINPNISGTVTLNLKNVTLTEILNAMRDTYGCEYEKTSYGYKVFARKLETRMFTINYLNIDRKGKSSTKVSSGQITDVINSDGTNSNQSNQTVSSTNEASSIDTSSDADFWASLKDTLIDIIGKVDGASVVVNPQAGLVIVHAYPDAIRNVAIYLDSIGNIMERQVIIEARILEVRLNAQYQSGIDWKALGVHQGLPKDAADKIIDLDSNITDFKNFFTLNISGDDFNTVIKLLNSQGKVNVLSSPRISTLNNQKAVIKVGNDNFYITKVKSNLIPASNGDVITSEDVDFTPFFSGIALDVTPQIDKEGEVTLHIHPIISKVTQENKIFRINEKEQNIPMAASDIRESDSVITAQNGQVVVIGGLMQTENSSYQTGTPWAEKLPDIGGLFKNTNRAASKTELVILLKPIVVEGGTWTKALEQSWSENSSTQEDFGYAAGPDRTRINLLKNK